MTGQVGPRGVAVLVLAGIAALLLAVLGWTQRGPGPAAPHSAPAGIYLRNAGPAR